MSSDMVQGTIEGPVASAVHSGATGSDAGGQQHHVVIGLNAVVIAVTNETPKVLMVRRPYAPLNSGRADAHHFTGEDVDSLGLPYGPFDPALHRTLEIGLRSWVEEQTQLQVGYVEQLYTFGDRGRYVSPDGGPRVVSVGYLALTREPEGPPLLDSVWQDWYRHFPWEDWRDGRPEVIDKRIRKDLEEWTRSSNSDGQRSRRWDRVRLCFGFDDVSFDEEKVLERYELLYEAGLVGEADRDRRTRALYNRDVRGGAGPEDQDLPRCRPGLGEMLQFDHRRVLATAMGRLRGKLKYRPVVFELMPPTFTLFDLQRTVEATAGTRVHKQNFRRLVEKSGLVEGTGQLMRTAGRPAEAFRFRREVLRERPAPGVGVPSARR